MMGFFLGRSFLSRTTSPLLSFLVSLVAVLAAMAGRDGEVVRMTRHWWAIVIAVEFFSVMLGVAHVTRLPLLGLAVGYCSVLADGIENCGGTRRAGRRTTGASCRGVGGREHAQAMDGRM